MGKKSVSEVSVQNSSNEWTRRDLLKAGATTVAALNFSSVAFAGPVNVDVNVEELSVAEMQNLMSSGKLTSLQLVNAYLSRIDAIDRKGPRVNSILEVNPDARQIASQLDAERAAKGPRSSLHGIPVVLKDNIDTADRMQTSAGSLALVGTPAQQDSTVAKRLRDAGAVILAKSNLSEWANFRSIHSSSGWSGRGGQCRNPYSLSRNPCGSSAGSAASVSANLTAVALGTETDGSIICPSAFCGVVGIKPTVGLTSRAGVVPISHTQDTVGPHGRTVADAAAVLGALTGVDPRDPATADSAGRFYHDYTQFVDPNGLRGARIGVIRNGGCWGYSYETDAIGEEAIVAMRNAGATVIDPANIPTADDLLSDPSEFTVLLYEFKRDLAAYLATRVGVPIRTLADAIEFNNEHAHQEMLYFRQELFEISESDPFSHDEYVAAHRRAHQLTRGQGIDAVMNKYHLDALFCPTLNPPWTTDLINGDHFTGFLTNEYAVAGYPAINVPAGFAFGLPVCVTFMGTAYSESILIKVASGFEAVTRARKAPRFSSAPDLETGFRSDRFTSRTSDLQSFRKQISTRALPWLGRL